jgi:hypothetical protein
VIKFMDVIPKERSLQAAAKAYLQVIGEDDE